MYSYDVAAAHRPPTTSRSIPGMRPSYDAEHPSPATPIYDALYSEYRRLFRALPGDRSGEEDMRFTGFAIRDPYPSAAMSAVTSTATSTSRDLYAFRDSYQPRAVEAAGYPQQQAFHTYPGHAQGTPQFMPAQQQQHFQTGQFAGQFAGQVSDQAGSGQSSGGQGWVATGYLTPTPPTPAPAPTPAEATAGGVGGRHRSMLSLPPGRVPGQG